MPAAEDIVVRIALAGEGEVIAALGEIGKVGEEAFGSLAESLGPVAEALAGIAVAVTGVGAAFGLWAKRAADVTVELSNLGTEMGVTIEEVSAFKGALSAMGVDSDTLAYAFKRLSFRIESEWDAIKKSTKSAADTIINNNLAIRSSQFGLIHAQESLRDARQALSELQGGDRVDPEVEAQHKRVDAVNKVKEAELKVAEARQKNREAAKKAAEDQLNDIRTVEAAVSGIIKGLDSFESASTKANLSFDNILKGIIADSVPAASALDGFKGSLEEIGNIPPESQAVFLRMADFFKNSGSAAINTALAYKVFGRGVQQDLIATMTQGSAAIQANEERLKKLGLTLSEVDKTSAFEFRRTFNALSYDLFTTFTQIGNLFGPAFVTGMKQMQAAIEGSHADIIAWASDVASKARPVIEDFFDVLTTGGKNIQTGWIKTIVDAFKNQILPAIKYAGEVVLSFFQVLNGQAPDLKWVKAFVDGLGQIKAAFGSIWDSLDETTKRFNATFGTEFSTVAVAVMGGIGLKMGTSLVAAMALGIKAGTPGFLAALAALGVAGFALTKSWYEAGPFGSVKLARENAAKVDATKGSAAPNAATFDTYFAPVKAASANLATSMNQAADATRAGSTKLVAAWELTGAAFIRAVNALGGPAKASGVPTSQDAFIEAVNSGGGPAKAVKNPYFNAPVPNQESTGLPNQKVAGDLGALGTSAETTKGKFDDIWGSLDGLKSTVDSLSKVFSGLLSQQPAGHAGGGIVHGPGTGTSDSILARVSRGEGIVRADGSNLMDIVRHFTGGFSLGGLVEGMVPRFATGGIVPATAAAGHYSVDLRTDKGTFRLQASEATARQLNRYAVDSRLVRTGPSPSWRT